MHLYEVGDLEIVPGMVLSLEFRTQSYIVSGTPTSVILQLYDFKDISGNSVFGLDWGTGMYSDGNSEMIYLTPVVASMKVAILDGANQLVNGSYVILTIASNQNGSSFVRDLCILIKNEIVNLGQYSTVVGD